MTVTIDDVRAAAAGLDGRVRRTPMLQSRALSDATRADVWLKAENLQRTGSFKIRGALNRIAALSDEERVRGVIAASAGNHAQGVAVAAAAYGVSATIVMPATAPLAKVKATRDYGADVVLSGDSYDDARGEAQRIAATRRLCPIHAFDDARIVAGQGTVGLEIAADLPDPDVVIVPVGGGGLAAGIAVALAGISPRTKIIGVQAEAATGAARSLAEGRAATVAPGPTIAEGIAVGGPGAVTFPLLQQYLESVIVVTEDEIAQAMVLLLERSKLVVEGAGAASVAALMSGKVDVAGRRAVAVLSGGNVDITMLARVVEHGLSQAGRYLTLTVGLDDRPGQLARLADVLSATGANVMSVSHQRFGIDIAVGRVQVSTLLEVRDRDHAREVVAALEGSGWRHRPGETPEFVPEDWLKRPD